MKDFLGNELIIGQRIVVTRFAELQIGTLRSVSPNKSEVVEHFNNPANPWAEKWRNRLNFKYSVILDGTGQIRRLVDSGSIGKLPDNYERTEVQAGQRVIVSCGSELETGIVQRIAPTNKRWIHTATIALQDDSLTLRFRQYYIDILENMANCFTVVVDRNGGQKKRQIKDKRNLMPLAE